MEETSRADKFVSKIDFNATNVDAAWKKFKAQFRVYALAKGYGAKSQEEQIANMLVLMGSESVPIYEQFSSAAQETLVKVQQAFDIHFEPVKNIIYERVKFNKITQGPTQTIHQFITEVQTQADLCEYAAMKGQLIRDRIVVGVRDAKLQEYLIDVEDLDLTKCIQKAKQYVSHHKQAQLFGKAGNTDDQNIDAVRSKDKKSSTAKAETSQAATCQFCGRFEHPRDKCPAKDSTCFRCKEVGHFGRSKACKKTSKSKGVQELNLTEESVEGGLFMGSLYL